MFKIIVCTLSVSFVMGCGQENASSITNAEDDLGGLHLCTLVGSSHGLSVLIESLTPLPANFAVAFNQDELDVDECTNDDSEFDQHIEFSADRTIARIFINLDFQASQLLRQRYIPDYSKPPQSNTIDVNLFSRPSCDDSPNQFQAAKDVQLTWTPIYINGENCGVSSYEGKAQIQLNYSKLN